MRAIVLAVFAVLGLVAGCSRGPDPEADPKSPAPATAAPAPAAPAESEERAPSRPWAAPDVEVTADNAGQLRKQAMAALEEGRLFEDAGSAVPIFLALRESAPDDKAVTGALEKALAALIERGEAALAGIDEDPESLERAREIAAVARQIAPEDARVVKLSEGVARAEAALKANLAGERELEAGRIGEDGGGAIAAFREALEAREGDARALQGLAAAESALIRRAEAAADADDYATAERWLGLAEKVRPDFATVEDARARLAALRAARIRALRDQGIAALATEDGIDVARKHLAALLRIAPVGDEATAELRDRINLAVHYGLFRPGQVFTDALVSSGGRGPQMVVVPHGAFRMGSPAGEPGGTDAERPVRPVRFDRGFAMSRTEVTVGEFRRFVNATGHQTRAERRGYSIAYDERAGNLVRRSGVDWQSDYAGRRASDDLPVVHVSAKDATAYAEWLSAQTGHEYRLPSEAEFEYALRAGSTGVFPWGDGAPPPRSGNYTGALDESPSGRGWRNAFAGYGDDAWGPAAVGRYVPNRYGLHDMAGNVAEWVADCWHDSYRRAPRGGEAWFNPGCRMRVVRGGSWASSPAQTRSAWRQASEADTTNARIGFRVVREI
ncbi:formylglycine-generating enzyme family protein [Lysobacter korlensis]|uniref:Formylglycine-generating enzyme family protein n=1 Tax=Lysobacter korlensis TaxID=553636 RepID=A0ABV6RMM2_9GAMM